jgi:hypothetical protein
MPLGLPPQGSCSRQQLQENPMRNLLTLAAVTAMVFVSIETIKPLLRDGTQTL